MKNAATQHLHRKQFALRACSQRYNTLLETCFVYTRISLVCLLFSASSLSYAASGSRDKHGHPWLLSFSLTRDDALICARTWRTSTWSTSRIQSTWENLRDAAGTVSVANRDTSRPFFDISFVFLVAVCKEGFPVTVSSFWEITHILNMVEVNLIVLIVTKN